MAGDISQVEVEIYKRIQKDTGFVFSSREYEETFQYFLRMYHDIGIHNYIKVINIKISELVSTICIPLNDGPTS